MHWVHVAPSALAAFLGALVECVEALTVVLAVGSTRGWGSALGGAAAGGMVLSALMWACGAALLRVPLRILRVAIGVLLLLFGARWLRKAVLRAAGVIPLRDEAAAYVRQRAEWQVIGGAASGWDKAGFAASFQITMLEGIEVVFIVIAAGAAGAAVLRAAWLGAAAALACVVVLGSVLHRPLSLVPENSLKFAVGVLLCAFGCFWVGEGLGVSWPGGDAFLLVLAGGFLTAACIGVRLSRQKPAQR